MALGLGSPAGPSPACQPARPGQPARSLAGWAAPGASLGFLQPGWLLGNGLLSARILERERGSCQVLQLWAQKATCFPLHCAKRSVGHTQPAPTALGEGTQNRPPRAEDFVAAFNPLQSRTPNQKPRQTATNAQRDPGISITSVRKYRKPERAGRRYAPYLEN